MDHPGAPEISPQRGRILAAAGSLLLLALIASCLASEPRPLFHPPPAGFSALAQDIAAFRGLPLKRDIALTSFVDNGAENNAYGPFELKSVERAYQTIGLLPANADLGRALTEFRQLEQLVTYDAAKGSVAVAPGAVKLGAPFAMTDPTLTREAPLGFAIVAALQEQNFQWQEKINSISLEDRRLAFRALATGDAALTLIARAGDKRTGNLTATDLSGAGRFAAEVEKSAARLPDFLSQQLGFPYREGSRFVLWALKAGGWRGVDALYAKAPLSTAEIVHPEKYFLERETPLRFFPAALLRSMKEAPIVEQSLGEHAIRGLLAGEINAKHASEVATRWRGDQLFAFQSGENFVTCWFSAWKSASNSAAFHGAYKNVLERRQRIRFDSKTEPSPNALTGIGRDGRGVWLESNGPVALWVSGVPTNRLREFADQAWKDLEIESDPTAIRFDSAGRWSHGNQWSLRKR